jgi:hypothetical protein
MSNSSILGGARAPAHATGKNIDTLGPSDSSDSGSDVQGERTMPTSPDNPGEWGALVTDTGNDSDAFGTGERASAAGDSPRDNADILPDRVIGEEYFDSDSDSDVDSRRDSTEAADLSDTDDSEADSEGEEEDEGHGARR